MVQNGGSVHDKARAAVFEKCQYRLFAESARRFNAPSEPFLPQKAHEYCAYAIAALSLRAQRSNLVELPWHV
jgi:hypothetical protein